MAEMMVKGRRAPESSGFLSHYQSPILQAASAPDTTIGFTVCDDRQQPRFVAPLVVPASLIRFARSGPDRREPKPRIWDPRSWPQPTPMTFDFVAGCHGVECAIARYFRCFPSSFIVRFTHLKRNGRRRRHSAEFRERSGGSVLYRHTNGVSSSCAKETRVRSTQRRGDRCCVDAYDPLSRYSSAERSR